jgi:hypothetical protein
MPWAPQAQVQPQAQAQAQVRAQVRAQARAQAQAQVQPQAGARLEPARHRSPLRETELHRGTPP